MFPSPFRGLYLQIWLQSNYHILQQVSVPIPGTISPNRKEGNYMLENITSFRPHSGDYISKLKTGSSTGAMLSFPSPFRGLYLQIIDMIPCGKCIGFPSPFRGLYLQIEHENYCWERGLKGFRPHSGDYISKYSNYIVFDDLLVKSFRPHSGDYISKCNRWNCRKERRTVFPSPFRGLYLQILSVIF